VRSEIDSLVFFRSDAHRAESSPPPNGLAVQLRATAPPWPDRSAQVQCQTLPEVDWNAMWLVSCNRLLGSRHRTPPHPFFMFLVAPIRKGMPAH
jgi:hypothetical protein